ncbi:MAG: asparagine synthase (glutamine-hydrolyzing) [Anaerolineae bacterium]
MCGIVGIFNLNEDKPIEIPLLKRMLSLLQHRGPDGFGFYNDSRIGLGSARLSIIDLEGGWQPVHNETETIWVVFNGEIFNYLELREELMARGHKFYTSSDTEVILHLYEERGPACLEAFNGQFAFALWDARSGELFLARDRLGIRPLYYTLADGALIFGSEIKALLADPRVRAEIDPISLDQVFTFWATLPPRTIFRDIFEVPPGHCLRARRGKIALWKYWGLTFPENGKLSPKSEEFYAGALRELLIDATRLRLRADVPVGAYLSGGLDSSTITALIRNHTTNRLRTFSIAFSDELYDERAFQERMTAFLNTEHSRVECHYTDIGRVFPQVIWHTETPILRTAPAPLYLLSALVRESGFKVVLTGEGADEVLAGYNIFKEDKIRRFWAREPDSLFRPLLLKRLYPYLPQLASQNISYLSAFFGTGLTATSEKGYSHLIRWNNTARLKKFFSEEIKAALAGYDALEDFKARLDGNFSRWHPLSQAQYIEIYTFLSQYLLSSQGDRMAMAHSVEGRFPFLDHRVVEFCSRIPPHLKLKGLREKYILKKSMADLLPAEVCWRPKQPYRAPIGPSFLGPDAPEYIHELLRPEQVEKSGCFNPAFVSKLVEKSQGGRPLSEVDGMALTGILSLQLVHRLFIEDFHRRAESALRDDAKLIKVFIR